MTDSATYAAGPVWKCPRGTLAPAGPAGIMGIVNLTPDSFFDGGAHDAAVPGERHARRLLAQGADILDLGGESSRPGAEPVTPRQEQERILPVLDALIASASTAAEAPVVSIDTYHAATAAVALEHGALVINDISACSFDPALLDVLVQFKPGYVLMHCQGTPKTMQESPKYDDVAYEVAAFFERELNRLVRAGLPEENIILDPGIGFGKLTRHNITLMRHPEAWAHLGRPSLMALSMKTVLGDVTGLPVGERGPATAQATALTHLCGYGWHRVHDVDSARTALLLSESLRTA